MRRILVAAATLMFAALSTTTASATEPPPVNPPGIVEGRQPSAYTGEFYIPSQDPYRQCIAQREGRHQYWGTGSNGFYVGTYQMTRALARGAAWMMGPELKDMFGKERGREIRVELHATDPTKWGRFYWDMAFFTVLNWEAPGSGARHWAGGRFSCWIGMPDWGGDR